MPTVHIENTVRDFDSWKAAFDKFEQFRAAQGVQAYRVTRSVAQPDRVVVDLDFATLASAEAFMPHLEQIWATPQSQQQLTRHSSPEIYDLVVNRSHATEDAS